MNKKIEISSAKRAKSLSSYRNCVALFLVLLCAGLSFSNVSHAEPHDNNLGLKQVWISGIFIPIGFDDNDEVVVTLDGLIPNSCHVLQQPVATKTEQGFKIDLAAKVTPGPCMINSTLPYGKVVSLGRLTEGTYVLEANDGLTTEILTVEAAPASTQDTYLYAEVSGAHVEQDVESKVYMIDLHLHYSYSCLELKETRVIDTGKVVVVLPIMENNGQACELVERQESVREKLPDTVTKGRYLLHVRSANGNSVNAMFNRW